MGTRHLINIKQDGKIKLGQYGQWDGYPEYCGVRILRILRDVNLEHFRNQVRQLKFITDEEAKDPKYNDFETYPGMTRDTSFGILNIILEHENPSEIAIFDCSDEKFGIEYVWTIDLDKNIFTMNNSVYACFDLFNLPNDDEFIETCEGA